MTQHGHTESDSQQLAGLALAMSQVWLPPNQQGFAEPGLHKLSKDLLSLTPIPISAQQGDSQLGPLTVQ